jgi:multicomponent Na+:H+ antiporter subunit G
MSNAPEGPMMRTSVPYLMGTFLLLGGTAFCVLGIYGMLRLPDIYNRLHATAVVITLGAAGILLSLLFVAPAHAALKGVATVAFLWMTAPMVTHTLSKAAHRVGIPLAPETERDDLAEDRGATPGSEGPRT